jgi:UDP-3-O-[3-hydroxymyristoyl] glucosamine N-acyltransferase
MPTLGEIARCLELELLGDPSIIIEGIAPLSTATSGKISFLAQSKFLKHLEGTKASAVILKPDFKESCKTAMLFSDKPYLTFAKLTAMFDCSPVLSAGVHPTAVIGSGALIDASAAIGANVYIGEKVVIGKNVVIEANSVVEANGDGSHLHANVTLYHGVVLGRAVTIHSGSVIGGDGFGFAPSPNGWQKIHQLGSVAIGDNVDIGANTCIDRGALEDTIIGNHVIIDNLVQIAHNCIIGDNTAIAGCTGIAGSSVIGKNCTIAGGVGIAGHLEIADGVHITAMSLVSGSIAEAGSYSSGTAIMDSKSWRKSAVRFTQLDQLHDRVKKIEKNL